MDNVSGSYSICHAGFFARRLPLFRVVHSPRRERQNFTLLAPHAVHLMHDFRETRFLTSAAGADGFPAAAGAEIAFAGRSNAGKSSALNTITGVKGLARTSNTPGRTQELNYFVPDGYSGAAGDLPPMALVDMPGYGYAKAPKAQVDAWTKLVFDYLKGRVTLKRVYLLIDARHGIKKNDEEVMDLLDKAAVSYQLVLTKADKIKQAGVPRLVAETLAKISKRPAAYPEVLATSSEKGEGMEELRAAIVKAVSGK
jgi:GTP-binding protein